MIELKMIKSIIDQRTKDWDDITKDDKVVIYNFIVDVLEYCKNNDIVFDETAGSVFIVHLTTLFKRINEDFKMEIDDEMISQIDSDLLDISEGISKLALKHYHKGLNPTEMFLIATHVGSMKERIKEKEMKNGKSENCHCS
ncbi:MAG: PRD domain-containing protein [Anaerorhabdus sp.]